MVPDKKGGSPLKLLRSLDSVPPTKSGSFYMLSRKEIGKILEQCIIKKILS